MYTTTTKWDDGSDLTVTYTGSGNGQADFISDANEGLDREKVVTIETNDKSKSVAVLVKQGGLREEYITADGDVYMTADDEIYGCLKQ